MKKLSNLLSLAVLALALVSCEREDIRKNEDALEAQAKRGGGNTNVTTFGGQATGLNAIVVNTENPIVTSFQTILAQTLPLGAAGGSSNVTHGVVNIAGVLTADSLTASINGQLNKTVAQSSATNVNLTIGGHTITASYLQSDASATCGTGTAGSSIITNLVIDGTPVTVTGAPNQTIFFPTGGVIVINKQSVSKKGGTTSITVTALHVLLPYGDNINIATSQASIKC